MVKDDKERLARASALLVGSLAISQCIVPLPRLASPVSKYFIFILCTFSFITSVV
jgi:hypothetical protein